MKNIEEMSIFGEYTQSENKLTAAVLQLLKIGSEKLIRLVSDSAKIVLPSSEINIYSQPTGEGSTPDGLLESSFTFKIYIESKLSTEISEKQLSNHLDLIKDETHLLYLTNHETRPKILPEKVLWLSWDQITDIFDEYCKNDDVELFEFLFRHFLVLKENLVLTNQKWNQIINNNQVLILAGSHAESFALKHLIYFCQNNRKFKPSEYMAFYNNGEISHLFKIVTPPENNKKTNDLNQYDSIDPKTTLLFSQDKEKQVFKLELVNSLETPIINDKKNKNGHPCPYTYGSPRYTTLNKFKNAKYTSQL